MSTLPSARPPRGYAHAIRYYTRATDTSGTARWVIVMELRQRVFGIFSKQVAAREVVVGEGESLSTAAIRTAIENLHTVGLEPR